MTEPLIEVCAMIKSAYWRLLAVAGIRTCDQPEERPEAAEDDGAPLHLDLHEDDAERGRGHAYKSVTLVQIPARKDFFPRYVFSYLKRCL